MLRAGDIGERGVIERLRRIFDSGSMAGDDAAVLPPLSTPVITVDSFFQGTHFHPWWAPPDVLGRRLLNAAVSDIAAMGAEPACVFAALMMPPDTGLDWLEAFYSGLSSDGIPVAGGETVAGDRIGVTLTAVGEGGDPETLLRRSALKSGDVLWTGGKLGRSLGAPKKLKSIGGLRGADLVPAGGSLNGEELKMLRAFLQPRAQVRLGRELRRLGVRCAIDISDGLFSEAQHLSRESGVGVVLELNGDNFFSAAAERPMEAAAAGEDFVLLAGAAAGLDLEPLGCIRVGRAEAGFHGISVYYRGERMKVEKTGYDHMEVSDGQE